MNDTPPTEDSGTELANTEASALILAPDSMKSISDFANFMAKGEVMVPDHLKGKPADLAAIVIQSMQWGMNPYSVAQKTHLVSGTLGYEAQLVNAVITSSTAIEGRFHYKYSDGWERLAGKVAVEEVEKSGRNNSKYTVQQPVAKWDSEDEAGLWVQVGARLRGEEDIQYGEKLFLSSVLTRNSPLWITKPDQQAAYLAVKYWSRLYTPQVILGVYTTDELDKTPRQEKDITPDGPHKSALRRGTVQPETAVEEETAPDTAEEKTAEPEVVDGEIVEDLVDIDLIPMEQIIQSMEGTTTIEKLDIVRSYALQYAKGSAERNTMAAKYKERKAAILLAQDAQKEADTEAGSQGGDQ